MILPEGSATATRRSSEQDTLTIAAGNISRYTAYYSWSTDSKGRVPMGSGTEVGGGAPGDIFTYLYP